MYRNDEPPSLNLHNIKDKSGYLTSQWVSMLCNQHLCLVLIFPLTFFSPVGLVQFRSSRAQDLIISGGLAPLRYLDDQGHPTEEYPLNPNGSPQGIAGLCSRDGRHLAMMPHPERCTLSWQWPWAPRDFRPSLTPSPWLRMFKNAASWCSNQE